MTQPAAVEVVTKESKPGWLTTEFWASIGVLLLQFLNLIGAWDFTSNRNSTIVIGLVTGLYALARGLAKLGQPHQVIAGVPRGQSSRRTNR